MELVDVGQIETDVVFPTESLITNQTEVVELVTDGQKIIEHV